MLAVDPVLVTITHITTLERGQVLTNATGFFYSHAQRLYLVTNRHVLIDENSQHFPDTISIEIHVDQENLARYESISLPLYQDNSPMWKQGADSASTIDVAIVEIKPEWLPKNAIYQAFKRENLLPPNAKVKLGQNILIAGFPLGFRDDLHRLPIVRSGIIASSYGLRFQGMGYFLTDARTHRGSSGAPVIIECDQPENEFNWQLAGIHSARFDIGSRDQNTDEALGVNCAWYTDILITLTEN